MLLRNYTIGYIDFTRVHACAYTHVHTHNTLYLFIYWVYYIKYLNFDILFRTCVK